LLRVMIMKKLDTDFTDLHRFTQIKN